MTNFDLVAPIELTDAELDAVSGGAKGGAEEASPVDVDISVEKNKILTKPLSKLL